MASWPRKFDNGYLDNLARKAHRRGDAAEAVTRYRALSFRQTAEERAHMAAERRWKFNNDSRKLKDMQEELTRLRRYATWHPQQIERAKAAEASGDD